MTNYERIQSMSKAELAELIARLVDHEECRKDGCPIKEAGFCDYPFKGCDESALDWLEREVDA